MCGALPRTRPDEAGIGKAVSANIKTNDLMALKIHRKLLAWAVAVAVSLGVFSLYVHPDFMVMLANQVWACF